jgi:hypothetical protein
MESWCGRSKENVVDTAGGGFVSGPSTKACRPRERFGLAGWLLAVSAAMLKAKNFKRN